MKLPAALGQAHAVMASLKHLCLKLSNHQIMLCHIMSGLPSCCWRPGVPLSLASRETSALSCGEFKCRPHFLHLSQPQGNVTGRRGRLITPTTVCGGGQRKFPHQLVNAIKCANRQACKHQLLSATAILSGLHQPRCSLPLVHQTPQLPF